MRRYFEHNETDLVSNRPGALKREDARARIDLLSPARGRTGHPLLRFECSSLSRLANQINRGCRYGDTAM